MLSSIFSFFKRNAVKVTSTDKGGHGNHWYALLSENVNPDIVIGRVNKSLESGKQYVINKKLILADHPSARILILGNKIITGFPCWIGSEYISIETVRISEWSQTKKWEASILARHESGCGFSFFAIDYALKKQTYKTNKHCKINLVGITYVLRDCDVTMYENTQGISFSKEFCGYTITEGLDNIAFVGIIEEYHEHAIDDIAGFIIRMKLTPSLSIETFIAKINLTIELEIGKQVDGVMWLIGSLQE